MQECEILLRYSVRSDAEADEWHYTLERHVGVLNRTAQRQRAADGYLPSDVYLTLNGRGIPGSKHALNFRELAVHALCTNGVSPSSLPVDPTGDDFVLQSGVPAESVRCAVGPSAARATSIEGNFAWNLLSRLFDNYRSIDAQPGAAEALRELLGLYAQVANPLLVRHADAVRDVTSAHPSFRSYLPATPLHTASRRLSYPPRSEVGCTPGRPGRGCGPCLAAVSRLGCVCGALGAFE
jgi:type VI secretion system protein ImpG